MWTVLRLIAMQLEIDYLDQKDSAYPKRLLALKHPPKQLYCSGGKLSTLLEHPTVAIVGSRNITSYGRQTTYDFARRLAEQGVVVISGLAIGVDALAHEAALAGGGKIIAVLPTSLNNITPRTNRPLARQILQSGGALISEYGSHDPIFKTNFVARNRIVAGLADVLLITEASTKSGTLHTARFALLQTKTTVMAVPGSIHQPNSMGANNLLKAGALPATKIEDILQQLHILPHRTKLAKIKGSNPAEQSLLDLMIKGVRDGEELVEKSQLTISSYNQALVSLEINGKIRALGEDQWAII